MAASADRTEVFAYAEAMVVAGLGCGPRGGRRLLAMLAEDYPDEVLSKVVLGLRHQARRYPALRRAALAELARLIGRARGDLHRSAREAFVALSRDRRPSREPISEPISEPWVTDAA